MLIFPKRYYFVTSHNTYIEIKFENYIQSACDSAPLQGQMYEY